MQTGKSVSAPMHKLRIDSASWATLNRLLDEALDRDPEAVEPWLSTLPADVAPLVPRLRELLTRAGALETEDFLETLPKIDVPAADTEQAGAQVGNYRLLRELGSGGMGVVWLAERVDGLINRPVALKLPHGAWKRAGLAERMARERDILASLNHPHIAHLYDAGVTTEGQPYLAIEYVAGEPIDEYCTARALDIRARLALFAQVAAAVAYAHGKLVVHRDLKPANILVDARGHARLLDFGIAKLLDEGATRESRMTELSGRALTPDYASPEQIRGEPLTIASDVYSLGVVLYELLSGQRPYRLRRDSRGALEEAILAADPPPPSERAGTAARRPLRGDLDTVVLKALRKEPQHRYATVHALLEDIERHLASLPVLARPDSRWYRARKFVARNRLAVSAASAVLVAIVAGATTAAWQAHVAIAQRERAEEVQDFIASIFREADPTQGRGKALTASELLLQAERRLRGRAAATPALRAQMLTIIGESLFGLQDIKESARVLEAAAQARRAAPHDPALDARIQLALSQAYEYLGRNDDALAQLALAFDTLREGGLEADVLFVRAKLHESAMGLATSDYTRAERAGEEALAAALRITGPRSAEAATAMQFISKAYLFEERAPEAIVRSKEALDLTLSLNDGDYSHPRVIESAQYYANALIHVGDLDAAATLVRDVTARAERVLGADSRMVGELLALGVPSELERGNVRAAVAMARRAVSIYLKDAEPNSTVHAYRLRLLGLSLLAARAGAEAEAALAEGVRVSALAWGPEGRPYGRGGHGLALAQLGRFAAAQAQIDLALAGSPTDSRSYHQAMRNQGSLLRLQGRSADAIPWLEKAIAAADRDAFDRSDRAVAYGELGLAQLDLGMTDEAGTSFAAAEALFATFQRDFASPARVDLLIGTGRVHLARRQFALALPPLQRADEFWREFAPQSRDAGEAAYWLGRGLESLGRVREARAALDRSATLLANSPLPADARLVAARRR
jgi:eukaryotic-like serine/threonine-protein kinase